MLDTQDGEIGYILKAYPRTSETFITNEIYQLEQLGLPLHIFSVKTLASQQRHGVVGRIKAAVMYLPEATPLAERMFLVWLWINLPRFIRSHLVLLRRRPIAYLLALFEMLHLCFHHRAHRFAWPRKVFCKEFLQAGYIARQVLEQGRVRHLHAHFCHGSTTIAMFAGRMSGLPFSFTAHAKDLYKRDLNPGDLLERKMRRAKFIVTCTGANHRFLDRRNAANVPIHTIYHGLDTTHFASAKEDAAAADAPLILSVGRIVEKKGYEYLVKACWMLKDKGYVFRCRIVGGADTYSDTLRRLIDQWGLQDVIAVQCAVTQEALQAIYERCTVFVLPCQILENGDRDGIPNVLVEAMAMQRPVVSTDISGIPELIEQRVNGLLVPQKDAAALATAIEELLNDRELRWRLGTAARAVVCGRFDSRNNTRALHTLFMACLQANGEEYAAAYATR